MKKFAFICRAVLLYGTVLYSFIYIMAAESLTENNSIAAFIGAVILLLLIVLCKILFKEEDLDDYKPKWFD